MTPAEYFDIWAPTAALWSRWAKPVIFTQINLPMPRDPELDTWKQFDVSWAPPARARDTAIVLELPGGAAAAAGLALAQRGYRPVPLYNSVHNPRGIVSPADILKTIIAGTDDLHRLRLTADAPPAFLLDARRMAGERSPTPGSFDNRWMVFPQDFPSGNFLRGHGIARALLVQDDAAGVRNDLAHVLRRWQKAGVALERKSLANDRPPEPLTVARPWFFGAAWYRALTLLRLRRHSAGGFGAVVPQPSSGGGYGGFG